MGSHRSYQPSRIFDGCFSHDISTSAAAPDVPSPLLPTPHMDTASTLYGHRDSRPSSMEDKREGGQKPEEEWSKVGGEKRALQTRPGQVAYHCYLCVGMPAVWSSVPSLV